MNIEKIKITKLKPNKANPRIIKDDKFYKLVDSLLVLPKMLELRPIVVDVDMTILGGNMRLRALQSIAKMSESELRNNLARLKRDDMADYWLAWQDVKDAPVVKASELTDAEKREFIIKDNSQFGSWDWDMLANEWEQTNLTAWGVDLPTEWESGLGGDEEKDIQEDDFDEEKDDIERRVSKGEIWQLGEHRLMCGDSTSEDDVEKLMEGAMADMTFTDPPYGVSIGDKNKMLNSVQKAGRCCKNIKNDTVPSDELYKILVKAMTNCRQNSKDDASYFVTAPQGGELGLMMTMMKDAGLLVRHNLIWEKNCATFSMGRLDYDYQHEPIMYTWTKSHHNYRKGAFRTSVWKIAKPLKCDMHPTMKPVELVANCLNDTTKENDAVMDLFGGSGTTLIACEQLNRKCYMMELDPHYCDVILVRWEKLTGKTATKLNE